MPVKIFVPKVPSNEEGFIAFMKKMYNTAVIRVCKNKDGSSYCIILLNYNDVKCANDVIKEISGKVIDDIVLKPRIYVDQTLLSKLSNISNNAKETPDDVVNTTHFSNGFYYIQLLSEKEVNVVLTTQLRDLLENYKSGQVSSVNYDDISVCKLYATFYNDEHQFYRIKVLEKHNTNEIKISFIDYGNEELVNPNNIVPITDKLAQIAPMVHKCVITGVKVINAKREEILSREILHRNYKAKLVKKKDDVHKVDRVVSLDYLDFTSISYRNYLIIEDVAEECKSNGVESQSRNGFKEEDSLVILTHFESLDEFYVQPVNKITDDAMTVLNNSIPNLVSNINDQLEYVGPEYIYLSQFSQDGNWYRCRIVNDQFDSLEPHCVVQYIDYGNTEIKYHKADLKPLGDKYWHGTEEIRLIQPCTKKCKFSDDLIYALSKAKMEKDYFHQNFVIPEKMVTFTYYFDQSNKVWIVDNIKLDDNEEIMSIVLQHCENTEKTDIYRLSNLEFLDKIWFLLVKSIDPTVQDHLNTLEKWSKEQNLKDLEPVKQVMQNTIYCAKLQSGSLVRCRVMGKAKCNVIIQAIDTGIYDMISIDSIFHLDESLRTIRAMAKPFKLLFDTKYVEEHQIEEKIVQILGNYNVELTMMDDNCIRDVIINEKSLVQCLAQLDYIQPIAGPNASISDEPNKEYGDLPDCLLPAEGYESEVNCVDFSLPSVEKMDEVPKDILILNSRVRFMRKLFNVGTTSIFDELFRVVKSCDKMSGYIECCNKVDDLRQSLETLNGEFISLSCNIKTKLRDFDPIIDKRTQLCRTICTLYDHLGVLLKEVSFENLESLLADICEMITSVNNLMEIFQIPVDKCFSPKVDILVVHDKIIEFRNCELFDVLIRQLERHSQMTNDLIVKYQQIMEAMYKDYNFGEVLPSPQTAVVPLIDCTYELHAALKSECTNFMKLLVQEDVVKRLDIISIVKNYYFYLHKQKTSLEMIVVQAVQLESLNAYAKSILADDSGVYQKIEENHKQIISFRSALKHSIADMEDAEEQDDREKIDEIANKIEEVRKSLHEALKTSRDMIDPEIRKLMIRKPELQLKNQSIFYCDEGIPVFLWDSIFFEIPHTDVFADFFETRFANDVVSMKRLSLNVDNYKIVLHNLTTYSSRINGSSESIVSLLPISYTFLSKSENTVVYMILPNFAGVHQLPEHFIKKLIHIVDFFKSTINQILNLWHLGFTYSERDLENGLFVTSLLDQTHVFLPLPLNSILNRENINYKCESIQVYFSKLGDLLQESLNLCIESTNINDSDIQLLVTTIKNCKGVEEAEHIFEDLDQFLTKFGPRENDNDLSNGNASSIEQLQYEEEVYIDTHNDSPVKGKSISITENIEIYSDIE